MENHKCFSPSCLILTCKSIRNKITDQESPISLTENDNNDMVNFILYIPVIHLKCLGHNIIVKRNMISTFITAIQARPKQFCHYKPYNSAPNTFRPASEANKKVLIFMYTKTESEHNHTSNLRTTVTTYRRNQWLYRTKKEWETSDNFAYLAPKLVISQDSAPKIKKI